MLRRWTFALAIALLPGVLHAQSGSGAVTPPPPPAAEEKSPVVPADAAILAADPAKVPADPAMTPTDLVSPSPPLRLQLDNGFTSLHTVLPPPANTPETSAQSTR